MKRISFYALAAASFFSLVACNNGAEEEKMAMQLQQQRTQDSLQSIIDAKDGEISTLFEMLNQIEDNLAMISSKYGAVQRLQQRGVEGNAAVKNEISAQISKIEGMLAANKKKIAELNQKLADLGHSNEELQQFVAKLEERSAQQEQQIASLMKELEQHKVIIKDLNQNVSDLTESNRAKDNTIAQQVAESNKAYFVVGTYDELKTAGIVQKTGGFIGIGRKQTLVADMPLNEFVEIDRSKVSTVTINQRNAVVISSHPADSYELVADENDPKTITYLRILNPSRFWRQTKYLVVSTK